MTTTTNFAFFVGCRSCRCAISTTTTTPYLSKKKTKKNHHRHRIGSTIGSSSNTTTTTDYDDDFKEEDQEEDQQLEKVVKKVDEMTTTTMREQGVLPGGVGGSGWTLMALLGWCAVAETTGILEPISAVENDETLNKTTSTTKKTKKKKTLKKREMQQQQQQKRRRRWKERVRHEASAFSVQKRIPRVNFQRGKTYFAEKRFKKSISDGRETKFDAKGEALKRELQKRKNVEILKNQQSVISCPIWLIFIYRITPHIRPVPYIRYKAHPRLKKNEIS